MVTLNPGSTGTESCALCYPSGKTPPFETRLGFDPPVGFNITGNNKHYRRGEQKRLANFRKNWIH